MCVSTASELDKSKAAEVRIANEEALTHIAGADKLLFIASHTDHMAFTMQTLLRWCDLGAPDQVLAPRKARAWIHGATELILKANILSRKNEATLRAIMLEQLKQRRQFYYGNKVAVIGFEHASGREALSRIQRIVQGQIRLLELSNDPRVLQWNL